MSSPDADDSGNAASALGRQRSFAHAPSARMEAPAAAASSLSSPPRSSTAALPLQSSPSHSDSLPPPLPTPLHRLTASALQCLLDAAAATVDSAPCESYAPESEHGSIEYKLKLVDKSYDRLLKLTTQMNYRLEAGFGSMHYLVGVQDNGVVRGISHFDMSASLCTIEAMAASLHASASLNWLRCVGREVSALHLTLQRAPQIAMQSLCASPQVRRTRGVLRPSVGQARLVAVFCVVVDDTAVPEHGAGERTSNTFRACR